MTQPETPESIPESDRAPSAAAAAEPPEGEGEPAGPEPEPWTAERVTEWNAYYDLYVMLGVLLLVFVGSANVIGHSSIWNQLRVGRLIAERGAPVTKDTFSYTESGRSWVNVPWLFEWAHAAAYRAGYDLAPADPADPVASAARAEQVGAGVLVAVNALARLLTALLLLGIRRPGPGKWWSAVCVALALGTIYSPAGWVLGGIAGPALVAPETWGVLFLAVELWLLHRAALPGRRRLAFALVPLFALWANVDETFLVGLLVLAAVAVGLTLSRRRRGPVAADEGLSGPVAFGVLAAGALACLANPSTVQIYRAGLDPLLSLFRPSTDVTTVEQLSYFGSGLRRQVGALALHFQAYYVLLVALGVGSFVLNRRRFAVGRFLVFALGAVLWGVMVRYGPEFAVIWAVTLTLNGQEWYQDLMGTEGRLGWRWSAWSVGGRAVTIVLLFLSVGKALTGYGAAYGESQFGFGFDPGEFSFEAASFLKTAPIKGNVLNTTLAQGDALVWRAVPERKVYMDSRHHLFPPELLNELTAARLALSTDDVDGWKPLLDKYEISAVMIQPETAPNTYQALSRSVNWIPFYDDGLDAVFGRADAAEADVAFFAANRLDPDLAAYRRSRPTPATDRPPTPVSGMDTIFQRRTMDRPQPHTEAARRWLTGGAVSPEGLALPDPARCLMAVREARTALASKPDDPQAFRLLATAYRALATQEAALLAGISLTPENAARLGQLNPRPDLLMTRFRERVTALNYAIQTTPPPRSLAARQELQALNLELYHLYLGVGFLDLARDRLQAVTELSSPGDLSVEQKAQVSQDLAQLNERVNRVQDALSEMAVDQQSNPIALANFARSQGAPGLALHELEEASRTGANPALIKPQLVDLYCDVGQPEKALELFSSGGQVNDPSFGTEPGVAALRQARTYFLLGNAEYGATLLEKYAIPALRYDRGSRAVAAAAALIKGQGKAATASLLELPEKLQLQSQWAFEAGLYRLEAGTPALAADHFTSALTLTPDFTFRPIVAYYLEKLGKPVPPPSEDQSADAAKDGTGKDEAAPPEKKEEAAPEKKEEAAPPKKKEEAGPSEKKEASPPEKEKHEGGADKPSS